MGRMVIEHGNEDSGRAGGAPAPRQPFHLLTVKQAMAYLQVSRTTLWRATCREDVACVRIGRALRYRLADLDAYTARLRAGGDAA